MEKEAQVKLLYWTPEPIKLLYTAYRVSTPEFFNTPIEKILEVIPKSEEDMKTELKRIMDDLIPPVFFEFLNMTFLLRNVSRAFQQQLTRHRIASYYIQSLRIASNDYAKGLSFTVPSTVKNRDWFERIYDYLQTQFGELLESGELPENARGILPLSVHSDIFFSVNYRALRDMASKRLCLATQEEYRIVMAKIKQEVKEKIDPFFSENLNCGCVKANYCLRPEKEFCGVPLWTLDSEKLESVYNYDNNTVVKTREDYQKVVEAQTGKKIELKHAESWED